MKLHPLKIRYKIQRVLQLSYSHFDLLNEGQEQMILKRHSRI
jgi:hypothetical protein